MRQAEPDVHHIATDVVAWSVFDSKIKAEISSAAISTSSGVYLVDPIAVSSDSLCILKHPERLAGVIVTNANHDRASKHFANDFKIPIYATHAAEISSATTLTDGDLAPDLRVVTIEGAAPGEIALHLSRDLGTLVIGDALINFGSSGFSYLPAKYCTNAKQLRRSLRQLLDLPFERILFAHGAPIVKNGRERLIALLGEDQ